MKSYNSRPCEKKTSPLIEEMKEIQTKKTAMFRDFYVWWVHQPPKIAKRLSILVGIPGKPLRYFYAEYPPHKNTATFSFISGFLPFLQLVVKSLSLRVSVSQAKRVVNVGLASCLLMFLLVGCNKENDYKLAFSHNLHVTENGMACTDCHGKMTDGRFALPKHAACKECHEDWTEAKKIDGTTCGKCHKIKDLRELSLDKPEKLVGQANGVFMHSAALTNRCSECHGSLLDKKVTRIPEMTHAVKVQIREKAHRWGLDCSACHVDMNPKTPPPSHNQNWTRRHGALGTAPDNVCSVCHRDESCRECHQVTQPASHNNLWRLKTHGIQGAWDRARCQVCHQQDFCDACHADTRPQSHNAGWGQNHCLNCHISKGTGSGCSVCHSTDIASHPNPHPAGWRDQHCSTCHLNAPGSQSCSVCHEGVMSIANHPNPHPAGWLGQHCNSCHPGSPDSQQCSTCHGSIIEGHPSPHPAGWLSQHCTNCHAGAPDADKCAICHVGVTSVSNHPNPHSVGWRNNHCFSCHEGTPAAQCAVCHPGGNNTQVHSGFWPIFHNHMNTKNCGFCHQP